MTDLATLVEAPGKPVQPSTCFHDGGWNWSGTGHTEESTEPRIDLPEVFLQSRIYRLQSKPSVYCCHKSLAGNFGGTRALLGGHAHAAVNRVALIASSVHV